MKLPWKKATPPKEDYHKLMSRFDFCPKCNKHGYEFSAYLGMCSANFERRYCPSCQLHDAEALHVVCPVCGHNSIEPCRDSKVQP